eukprot:jgi/Botrbrau1/3776/Bobra.0183s0011.1
MNMSVNDASPGKVTLPKAVAVPGTGAPSRAGVPATAPAISMDDEDLLNGEGPITASFLFQAANFSKLLQDPDVEEKLVDGFQNYFQNISDIGNFSLLYLGPLQQSDYLEASIMLGVRPESVRASGGVGNMTIQLMASGWSAYSEVMKALANIGTAMGQPAVVQAMQDAGVDMRNLVIWNYSFGPNVPDAATAFVPPLPVDAGMAPTPPPVMPHDTTGSKTGIVLGTVVGISAFLVLAMGAALFWLWRRRKTRFHQGSVYGPSSKASMSDMRPVWSRSLTPSDPTTVINGKSSMESGSTLQGDLVGMPTLGFMNGPLAINGDALGCGTPSPKSQEGALMSTSSLGLAERLAMNPSWEIDPAELKYETSASGEPILLGSGAFGKVYKAKYGVQTVAVKEITCTGEKQMAAFCREVEILQSLRDANIVQFLGACLKVERPLLVTEFMQGGDLYNAFSRDHNGVLLWYKRGRKIALDIARGLHKMHSQRIIHLDIKSSNILLTGAGIAKIADVGVSKFMMHDQTNLSSLVGTFEWTAPEVINGLACGDRADCYSFGVVLWEIVTAERPFKKQFRDPEVPKECPQDIKDLISSCLQQDPALRPDSKKIFDILEASPKDMPPAKVTGNVEKGPSS